MPANSVLSEGRKGIRVLMLGQPVGNAIRWATVRPCVSCGGPGRQALDQRRAGRARPASSTGEPRPGTSFSALEIARTARAQRLPRTAGDLRESHVYSAGSTTTSRATWCQKIPNSRTSAGRRSVSKSSERRPPSMSAPIWRASSKTSDSSASSCERSFRARRAEWSSSSPMKRS